MRRRHIILGAVAAAGALGAAGAAQAVVVPNIDYSCAPGPADCSGWHNYDVTVTWRVTNASSSTGCDVVTISTEGSNTAECSASAGSGPSLVTLNVKAPVLIDKTAPTGVSGAPARAADVGDWFTSPVDVAFSGTDALSGIASCSTVRYAGPDTAAGSVSGTCTDVAGNTSAPLAVPIKFDTTPPQVSAISALPGDGAVTLTWSASPDVRSVRVIRTAARKGAKGKVVYAGSARAFRDRGLANGGRYTYEVLAVDAAGNVTRTIRRVTVGPSLLAPLRDARSGGVTLRWTGVRGAQYYNVQLFRNGKKLLSAWPGRARLHVPARWRFGGSAHALAAGVYRWYVWPGLGARVANRFGSLIGSGTFVVRRGS